MANFIRRLLGKVLPPNRISFTRGMRTILSNFQEGQSQRDIILAELREQKKRSEAVLSELKEEKKRSESIISELKEERKRSESIIDELKQDKILNQEFAKELSILKESDKSILKNTNEIVKNVPQKILYNNDFERSVIGSFHDITENSDFKEKFLSLIQGLDAESIGTLIRIFSRQQRIKNNEGKFQDLYTVEEQQHIQKLKDEFSDNILKISDDLYCYKNYFLPVKHFEAAVFYDKHGLNCVENLKSTKNKNIIDVGAFIGDSALILSPLTEKKIYSFEPVKENYEILLQTIELNNITNVIAENVALGSQNTKSSINVSGSASGLIERAGISYSYQEFCTETTLDEYVDKHLIEVGLIKVDVEGYEQEFLKGAEKTIKTQKPVLLLSIYHNANDFFTIKPLIESWNLGYKFKIHKPVDFTISREVLLIAEIR